jgi:hypothetical protein
VDLLIVVDPLFEVDEELARQVLPQPLLLLIVLKHGLEIKLLALLLLLFGDGRLLFRLLGTALVDDSLFLLHQQFLELIDDLFVVLIAVVGGVFGLEDSIGIVVPSFLVLPPSVLVELEKEVIIGESKADGLAVGV